MTMLLMIWQQSKSQTKLQKLKRLVQTQIERDKAKECLAIEIKNESEDLVFELFDEKSLTAIEGKYFV